MIGAIRGKLIDKSTSIILIETNSGIFYEILISDSILINLPPIQSEILFYTSTIIREQEMYLIGFPSQEEKRLFEMIITAKGIGPKQAIKILSEFSSAELRTAIISSDTSSLTKIKGISTKKAEQLILDLRDKVYKTMGDINSQSLTLNPKNKQKIELLLTMRALGYSDIEIKKPLDLFFEENDHSQKSIEILVTEFLSILNKQKR